MLEGLCDNASTLTILLRGIEKILIDLCALLICYWGYKIYTLGHKGNNPNSNHNENPSQSVEVEGPIFKFLFSGYGPGVVFMIMGAAILTYSLHMPTTTKETSIQQEEILQLPNKM